MLPTGHLQAQQQHIAIWLMVWHTHVALTWPMCAPVCMLMAMQSVCTPP
jgi:hypothetical protein